MAKKKVTKTKIVRSPKIRNSQKLSEKHRRDMVKGGFMRPRKGD